MITIYMYTYFAKTLAFSSFSNNVVMLWIDVYLQSHSESRSMPFVFFIDHLSLHFNVPSKFSSL